MAALEGAYGVFTIINGKISEIALIFHEFAEIAQV